MQSIFSGLYSGVGAGIGGLAGGMLIYSYGDQVMFFAAAISIVIGWAMADAAYLMAQFRRGFKASMRGVQSMSYLAKISNVPPP